MSTKVFPAVPNCTMVNGEIVYSSTVKYDDDVSDNTIQAMSDNFSEVLVGMNQGVQKGRRLAAIAATEAAQEIEECAEDDENCGKISIDEGAYDVEQKRSPLS